MIESPIVAAKSDEKTRYWWMLGFSLTVFVALFVYFTVAHPLYAFDLDDWLYVYYGRHALPDVVEWNPAKVFPETLMPLVSYIGAYMIYPFSGDYVQALCYAFAATTCLFITGYLLAAAYVVRKRFQTSDGTLAVLSAIFLLGHFLPFLVRDSGNYHLFYANNVTCIFNYTIPALLNFILCCYFLTAEEKKWWTNDRLMQKALLVLAVYLAIHSNLLSNIILMALFGIQLLFALVAGIWENHQNKRKWISMAFLKDYIWEHLPKIAAILLWFVSMIFEISGERSQAAPSGLRLYESVHYFIDSVLELNPQFLVSVIVINLLALGVAGYRFYKKKETQFLYWQLEMVFCMGLSALYLVLVAAKVEPSYLLRSDVILSWMIFLMFMSLSSLAYLVRVVPRTVLAMPLLLYILFFETVTDYSTFADSFISDAGGKAVKAICDDMIAQVQEAEEAGLTEVEVFVPESIADGWPLDIKLTSDRLPKALYHHNLTETLMEVTIVPDPEKDAQFHLD